MDTIADMFTKIRNAGAVGKETVVVPYSKVKAEIAKLLQTENYIKDFNRRGKKVKKNLEIDLLYKNGEPAINVIKRVSKPCATV